MGGIPAKELKILVTIILNKFRRKMHEQSKNFNKEKDNILEVPNRSHGAEEYNHRIEKYNKGVQ